MTWAYPWAFLLFVPFLIGLWWSFKKKRSSAAVVLSEGQSLSQLARGLRAKLAGLPTFFSWLCLAMLIFALARPQMADVKIRRDVEGIDIVITFDISDSMLIEDMKPVNRIEASKAIIKDFIGARISDRIGLVVFSGEAYTRVPLTLDYPLLLKSVEEVETSRTLKMGTAIGVALANAAGRLKDSEAKSKVMIFLTDGENNTGTIDPETAIQITKGYGIKVYAIGMGRDGQAQLPVFVEDGRGRVYKQYRPIHSKVNEELLQRMATETGGKYWRANTSDALRRVFEEIDQLEKSKIEVSQYTQYQELFQQYVLWAIWLLVASLGLGSTLLRRRP